MANLDKHEKMLAAVRAIDGGRISEHIAAAVAEHEDARTVDGAQQAGKKREHPRVIGSRGFTLHGDADGKVIVSALLDVIPDFEDDAEQPESRTVTITFEL